MVRLVASPLGAAEDLALEFLGLQLATVDEAVARGRRQALGFPGWAANDPANGAYALAVVKDLERLARLVRSRPADARDGFEKLGDQLSRTVPHFLPTFYEQVGRIYIDAEQPNLAAPMFGRAREAERIYNLAVDEDRRREVFIEFALAGALSSKAIDDFADQLVASRPTPESYAIFRALCVQRTQGGIPPSTRMGERLNKMAAAAGLEAVDEAKSLITQLIDAPASARAAAGFWKAYRAPLLELARASAAFRGKLLNLFPSPQPATAGFGDWWLDSLTRSGATEALTATRGSVPPEAEATGGPAGWLTRTVTQQNQSYRVEARSGLQSLVERMADRLRSIGIAVDLIGPHAWWADLDLIDTAAAAGIPLAPPPQRHGLLHLRGGGAGRQPERDLAHVVADQTFGPELARALETDLALGYTHADHLPRTSGAQHLLREWRDRRADLMERGGLPQIEAVLATLEKSTSERTLALDPAARDQHRSRRSFGGARTDTARGYRRRARLARVGQSSRETPPAANSDVAVRENWPNLVVSDNQKAIVVGPDGILLEHDLRLQPRGSAVWDPVLYFPAGQPLVAWHDPTSRSTRAYWSSQPGQIFDATLRRGWCRRSVDR